jgi:hypothetical protein
MGRQARSARPDHAGQDHGSALGARLNLKIVHGSCPGRHAPPQSLWIGVVTRLHSLQGSDICLRHFPGGIVSSRHHGRLELAKNVFDIYTIIFLVLAVFIFLRLRSVLGQRTGRKRPPYDTHSPRDAVRGVTNDNVVRLPGRSADATATPVEPVDPAERWKGIAEPGSSLASGLDAIAREDKSFNAKHFVSGARTAYEMIVLAYAQGDRPTLRNLLSREVYEGFEAAIRERGIQGRDGREQRGASGTSVLLRVRLICLAAGAQPRRWICVVPAFLAENRIARLPARFDAQRLVRNRPLL